MRCVAQPLLAVSGTVSSAATVASITYTLNGATVTFCNNCGLSPSFNFNVTLAPCVNTLEIKATDVNGLISSKSKTIGLDATPPALSGCQDLDVTLASGQSTIVVNYPGVTALDNCDGAIPVTYSQSSGTSFPVGVHTVTCAATDKCLNTGSCSFTVTVHPAPPTAAGLLSFTAVRDRVGPVALRWQTGVEFDLLGFRVERQGIDGTWSRVEPGLIPALGSGRPDNYALQDPEAPAWGTVLYRLVEVDMRGRHRVVREAATQLPVKARIRPTGSGFEISIEGSADRIVVAEIGSDAVRGPWVQSDRVKLDGTGMSRVPVGFDQARTMRFYRFQAE